MMGYTKFCGDYGNWASASDLKKRIEHKVGGLCEVDWSGPTLGEGLVSPVTGEVSKIYLFVGVLGVATLFGTFLSETEACLPELDRTHIT